MKPITIIISAVTAFVISFGGSLGVVFVGGQPSAWQVGAAAMLGLVVAAKDTRSLLQLPPIEATKSETTTTLTHTDSVKTQTSNNNQPQITP